ncbi:MAG: hypothetical protein DWB45_02470 [Xanthomonadales bacterium]|nr:hypothetical protein [Xanthomonadales bacterium]MCC6595808.1 hypothetical protein [Rhodanobacteraceae bacterium]MDL1868294.1 hypothetical protein [Gammaproteobacteria bacterium PRO6]
MPYLLAGALALAVTVVLLAMRERRLRARRDLLRQVLDLADSFENQLMQCRAQLRAMPTAGTPASTEAVLDAGLRDLLAHRLWLKNESAQAALPALAAARDALAAAQQALQPQLQRLNQARADLDGARELLDAANKLRRP